MYLNGIHIHGTLTGQKVIIRLPKTVPGNRIMTEIRDLDRSAFDFRCRRVLIGGVAIDTYELWTDSWNGKDFVVLVGEGNAESNLLTDKDLYDVIWLVAIRLPKKPIDPEHGMQEYLENIKIKLERKLNPKKNLITR